MQTAFTRWGSWGEAFELRWPRPGYQILTQPSGPWSEAWRRLEPRRVPAPEAADFHEPGLEFEDVEPEGDPSAPAWAGPRWRYRVAWPAGGIFMPGLDEAQAPVYEPLKVAPDILLDVQRTRADEPAALLGFVNRWGRLGVGIPGAPDFAADGAAFTGEWLAWLTGLLQTVNALKLGQKSGLDWPTLAKQLTRQLANVHFGARPTRHGLVPHFPVPRLLEALVLEVWDMATQGKRLRQCTECRALFIHGREDKEYCSAACAKRRTVREWKRRQRQKRRTTNATHPRKEA